MTWCLHEQPILLKRKGSVRLAWLVWGKLITCILPWVKTRTYTRTCTRKQIQTSWTGDAAFKACSSHCVNIHSLANWVGGSVTLGRHGNEFKPNIHQRNIKGITHTRKHTCTHTCTHACAHTHAPQTLQHRHTGVQPLMHPKYAPQTGQHRHAAAHASKHSTLTYSPKRSLSCWSTYSACNQKPDQINNRSPGMRCDGIYFLLWALLACSQHCLYFWLTCKSSHVIHRSSALLCWEILSWDYSMTCLPSNIFPHGIVFRSLLFYV